MSAYDFTRCESIINVRVLQWPMGEIIRTSKSGRALGRTVLDNASRTNARLPGTSQPVPVVL